MVLALELFERAGFAGALRWLHVLFGITWIGLLYYFNFIQVPAFAELERRCSQRGHHQAGDAGAVVVPLGGLGTAIFGILIAGATEDYFKDFFKRSNGVSIFLGMIIALTMLYNVWMVIWPNQKIVIANAANVLAGGQPDPNAAAAGRRAFLASRQNTLFSISMLWFMVGTAHFYTGESFSFDLGAGKVFGSSSSPSSSGGCSRPTPSGFIGGTGPGRRKQIYETVRNVIISSFVLWSCSGCCRSSSSRR